MFSKLNFLGVANATKTTAVVASATTSAKAVVASATTLAKAVAGVATSAKKIGAVKKFTAFTAMALVAFSLTACGGGDSAASASDEGDEIYLAWFNKRYNKDNKMILEKVERFEGVATDSMNMPDGVKADCGSAGATKTNPELAKAVQVTAIMRTYKHKNEFRPEQEWKRSIIEEHFLKADFTPYFKDVEKKYVDIRSRALSRRYYGNYYGPVSDWPAYTIIQRGDENIKEGYSYYGMVITKTNPKETIRLVKKVADVDVSPMPQKMFFAIMKSSDSYDLAGTFCFYELGKGGK